MQANLERAVQHWNIIAPIVETPKTPVDYEALLANIEETMKLVCNTPNSPLAGLIKAMTNAAKEYEGNFLAEQQGSALLSLRYLIKLHRVKQSELSKIGSQGVVSEIVNGKRSLTVRHIRELARKFNVSPSTFIDA